jgi:4-alpha-glucanotransferase
MTTYQALDKRRAGILLHPTSLPGANDHGDIGHQAYRFVEFLHSAGISVWQMLPLGPTHEDGSPYQCLSVHAGNPLLISMDWLIDRGWLESCAAPGKRTNDKLRLRCIKKAFKKFLEIKDDYYLRYLDFIERESYWLADYSLFIAIRIQQNNAGWVYWPGELRERDGKAMQRARVKLKREIDRIQFEQFVFFQQWLELKQYAHNHNVMVFGDMPIFVAHDSAEVWAHREYFSVDEHGQAISVAGVPPDYFSATGQRWGNPLYDWERMQNDGFIWWTNRMQTQLELFDLVRIDHFRGFESYWEIPADEETAINGHWIRAPGWELLEKLHEKFNPLPIIAEDLGIITHEVDELRKAFNIPGMKILQFAFSGDASNPYLPHHHEENCVVYTGTHDNDTSLAWFQSLSDGERQKVDEYLGNSSDPMPWPLIRSALSSVSRLCIIPMQDILSLAQGHRMNTPGTQGDNWQWRFGWEQVPEDLAHKLKGMLELYQR